MVNMTGWWKLGIDFDTTSLGGANMSGFGKIRLAKLN